MAQQYSSKQTLQRQNTQNMFSAQTNLHILSFIQIIQDLLSCFISNIQCLMQTERPKPSTILFEQDLQSQEIQSLIQQDQQLLKKLIAHCGKRFQKQLKKNNPISTFLKNYKSIMKAHSLTHANVLSVNICIHFAILCSQNLLRQNRESEAKNLLKQASEYSEIEGTDSMLLAVAYNNLAHLHYKQGKLYKALAVGLAGIEIMQCYIEAARFVLEREKLTEDVLVFVNILSIVLKILTKILKVRDKDDFRVLYKNVNKLGYSYSMKYLGKNSLFTKKFYISETSIILPVYQELNYSQVHPFSPRDFELKLAGQLQLIYKKLAELNLEPEVFYIRENLVKNKESLLSSIIAIDVLDQPQSQPEIQYQVHYCEQFALNDEKLVISILRDSNELSLDTQSYSDFRGHLEFKTILNSEEIVQRVHQEKFQKIVSCLSFKDFMPYELRFDTMSSPQFCRRVLIHFLKITEKRRIQISPRSIGLLEPFYYRFCGENVLIFVNHVCFRKFRVAICPPLSCDTLYLDLCLSQEEKYLRVIEIQNQKIKKFSLKYNENHQNNKDFFAETKRISVFEKEKFKDKIQDILNEFERFIQQIEHQMITEISSISNLGDQQPLYLCSEDKQNKKMFVEVKYRSNVNNIQIYLKNTHKSYTPNGVSESKGSSLYSPEHFIRDFSFGLKNARKNLPPFLSIIAKKFSLKTFNQPVQQHEYDRLEQNAIQQLPLNSKFFKRKFIKFQDYQLPVTLELVTVKNEKPVGIRVSAYEPIKCVQTGVFIYLVPEYWLNSQKQSNDSKEAKVNEIDNLDSSNTNNQFEFQKRYFLSKWLKEEGFDLIYSKIVIVNRSLELRGVKGKFCGLEEVI